MQEIWRMPEKNGGLSLADLKTYYKATVLKQV